jgi:hypothetical protein
MYENRTSTGWRFSAEPVMKVYRPVCRYASTQCLCTYDGAVGELLEKLHEVLLGEVRAADELGGDCREEGEVCGGVEGRDLVKVLLLERVIPGLEVFLLKCKTLHSYIYESEAADHSIIHHNFSICDLCSRVHVLRLGLLNPRARNFRERR